MARERKFTTRELFHAVKHLLLEHGYDAFHFGLMAERLEVSRASLYKYYKNKDELITALMNDEMDAFLVELAAVEQIEGFEAQYDRLVDLFFQKKDVLPLIQIARHMMQRMEADSQQQRQQLEQLPLAMYETLQRLIAQGKQAGVLKAHLPDSVMLGLLFQTIAVPNHYNIPHAEWVAAMKEVLGQGMFTAR